MLQHTLDQLASDFASRLIGALRAAPLGPVPVVRGVSAIVGNQPIGTVEKDITTAYAGGSFVGGVWTQPDPANPSTGRDDRLSESTIGNYVANALRDSLADPLLSLIHI